MTKSLSLLARRVKRWAPALRNAPLYLIAGAVSVSIEVFAWGAILAENQARVEILGTQIRLGYAEVVMSTAFSLAALILSGAAAAFQADPRPQQRRRAGAAQCLAIMVLIAPVYYAGNCLAYQRQLAQWSEYSGSAAEAADRALTADRGADSRMRAQAAMNLRAGIRPERAEFDPAATAWIALLLGANMLAVRLGWRARRESPAEARERRLRERAAKSAWTKAQNAKAEARASNVFRLRA